jgi:hypothetical protein
MSELQYKMEHGQHEAVQRWFKAVKDHTGGDLRRDDFATWMR